MIHTERLLIRPWAIEDVPHYKAMSLDVGYTCFSPPGSFLVKDDQEALQRVNMRIQLFNEARISKFVVLEKKTGSFVGTCGGDFFEIDGKREVELGYRVMLSHWGKGYATEAAHALVDYLLHDVKLENLYGFALHQNKQSLKILEKIGMKYLRDMNHMVNPHRLYRISRD